VFERNLVRILTNMLAVTTGGCHVSFGVFRLMRIVSSNRPLPPPVLFCAVFEVDTALLNSISINPDAEDYTACRRDSLISCKNLPVQGKVLSRDLTCIDVFWSSCF
jgi:hypothetical protein